MTGEPEVDRAEVLAILASEIDAMRKRCEGLAERCETGEQMIEAAKAEVDEAQRRALA